MATPRREGGAVMAVALFAAVALVTAGSAVGVVVSKSIIRSAVWLLFTLVGVSLTYFLLGAAFLAATQLIVYVGGTLVLLVFGGMLTAGGPFNSFRTRPAEWGVGIVLTVGLFALLANAALREPNRTATTELPGVGPLGLTFLGINDPYSNNKNEKLLAFLLPFEIVSVHLLVVLVGAAYLARAKKKPLSVPSRASVRAAG
ncbi:MAG TPA: NADH-quinone oxidoreductase subunit J, partial [Fimbriiglobus sp.]